MIVTELERAVELLRELEAELKNVEEWLALQQGHVEDLTKAYGGTD